MALCLTDSLNVNVNHNFKSYYINIWSRDEQAVKHQPKGNSWVIQNYLHFRDLRSRGTVLFPPLFSFLEKCYAAKCPHYFHFQKMFLAQFTFEKIGNAVKLSHKTLIPHVEVSSPWTNFKVSTSKSIEVKETKIYPII